MTEENGMLLETKTADKLNKAIVIEIRNKQVDTKKTLRAGSGLWPTGWRNIKRIQEEFNRQ